MNRYKLLILVFPHAWRESYQDELLDLVAQEAHRRGQAIDLVRAGLRERRHTWTPASAGAVLASLIALGSLLLCWCSSPSLLIQPVRWLLTAGFFGLLFVPGARRRGVFGGNRVTPVALRRGLTGAFIAVSVGSTATAITSSTSSRPSMTPSRVTSAQDNMPASPSIQSTLSAQVAATPGIVTYLQSDRPKSEEFVDGHTVWVGTGNAAQTRQDWPYPQTGGTVAGTYQPVPFLTDTPVTWPTVSVASASARR